MEQHKLDKDSVKDFQNCLFQKAEQSPRSFSELQWPLLLTWFNFNPSMDK